MMDVAVPANMRQGLHQEEVARRGWAVSAQQAKGLVGRPDVALIDLREKRERERSGAIPGSLPYDELQDNIGEGGLIHELAQFMTRERRYMPGDRLPSEKEIMSEFGVGRSAVREAMLSLQKMGLLTVSSGERAKVTAPTADAFVKELSGAARLLLTQDEGIQRFQEARALFEIGLVRFAAQQATKQDIDALHEALDANGRSIGNQAEFMRTDVDFHYAIAAIGGNLIFTSLYNAVVEWLTDQREISGRATDAGAAAFAAHTRIFNAIAAHDTSGAQIAMQEHLDQVVGFYWEVKQSRELAKTS
jgi:DNA-binding FadR family transcriptional regulator